MIPAETIVQDWYRAAHAGELPWGMLSSMCIGAHGVAVACGDGKATRIFSEAGTLAYTLAGCPGAPR